MTPPIGTLIVLLAEHPPAFVTINVRPTLPEPPALYVIVWMFVALVIVPFVIDHAYVVAPAGPDAVLPVELGQTVDGVGVIVGVDGPGLIVTLTVLLAGQPAPFVTVSVRSTV